MPSSTSGQTGDVDGATSTRMKGTPASMRSSGMLGRSPSGSLSSGLARARPPPLLRSQGARCCGHRDAGRARRIHTNVLAGVVTGGSLRAIAGDFYDTGPPGKFEVVAYFDGFRIGTDEDQRRLLRRIVGWLVPGGCALVDVLVPWYWSRRAGNEEEFPPGSGVRYLDGFDPGECRMTERMWRVGHEDAAVTQSLGAIPPPTSTCCSKERDSRLSTSSPSPTRGTASPVSSPTRCSTSPRLHPPSP